MLDPFLETAVIRPRLDRALPSLRRVALELALIVFGVLAALWANEWRQDRERTEHTRRAMDSIVAEIRSNREAMESSRAYHEEKMRLLRSYAAPDSAGRHPAARAFDRGFIAPAQVLSTAWEGARSTGALAELPWDTHLLLGQLYARQHRYDEQAIAVGEIIYSRSFDGGAESIVSRPVPFASVVATFWWRERQMVEAYDEVLTQLNPEG